MRRRSVAGRDPCSLCFLEFLFAVSIPKFCQNCLISFVKFRIGSLELRTRLRIHGRLRLRVSVRDGNEQ